MRAKRTRADTSTTQGAYAALMAAADAGIAPHGAEQQQAAEQAQENAANAAAAAASSDSALSNPFLVKTIFECLNVQDLCSAAVSCKLWKSISESADFWRSVSFDGRSINRMQVIALLQRHANIEELNLRGVAPGYANEGFFRAVLPRLRQLRMLTVHKEALTDSCFVVLGAHLPALRQLILDDVALGASRLEAGTHSETLLLTHPHLLEAAIVGCRGAPQLSFRCEQLHTLSLAGSHVTLLNPMCPQLRSLDLSGCTKLQDVGLRGMLTKVAGLTQLKMEGGVPVSDDTLREMATALPALSHLSIARCLGVTLSGVRNFNALTYLDMSCCESLAPATVLPALQTFLSLQHLVLDGCGLLTSLVLALPQLRVLSALGCRALAEVELRCRSLVEVALGPSPSGAPGCAALRRVTLASDAMQALEWRSFSALDTLALDCPRLKELTFADCDGLRDWTLGVLGDRVAPVLVHGAAGGGAAGGGGGAFQGGDAGVPRLERLRVEGCEGLRRLTLRHSGLQALTVGNCKHLSSLSLQAPQLTSLCLEENGELQQATLLNISVPTLSMGACSALTQLELASDTVTSLDLRGCGCLRSLQLNCPALKSVDAKFCGELSDECIQQALARAPPLESLVLSVCPLVGDEGLAALGVLSGLVYLDLSYTEVQDLAPVYQACPQLQTLNLSSCRCLRDDALQPLLLPHAPALPHLRELDASYCALPASIVVALLRQSTRLEVLALNGCDGVTDSMWKELNCRGADHDTMSCTANRQERSMPAQGRQWAAEQQQQQLQENQQHGMGVSMDCSAHQLQSLSLVRCSRLKSLCLGLVPAPGTQVRVLDAKCYLLASHPPSELSAGDECHVWEPAGTPLVGLRSLRLGLSGVQVLALALPQLANLDLSRCTQLRVLELRCPLLLTLHMQACKALPMLQLLPSLAACSALEMLDLQHTSSDRQLLSQVRAEHGSLHNLLTCPRGCSVCRHQC